MPPVYYKVLAYKTNEASTGYAAYTDVGDTNLVMYIMCSDDNPFDTANFGTIRKYEISAE